MSSHSSIHRDMPIMEIVTFLPQAKTVLAEYGLHCFNCSGSQYETLGEGCLTHGFSSEDIDELVDDLNQMLKDAPRRPETLTLTAEGARAIKNVAEQEGRAGEILEVTADAGGGFCMEFKAEKEPVCKVFCNEAEPSVRIMASALTLGRIGGATIDFRDGRFKLDLPEDRNPPSCACDGGTCGCGHKPHGKAK